MYSKYEDEYIYIFVMGSPPFVVLQQNISYSEVSSRINNNFRRISDYSAVFGKPAISKNGNVGICKVPL